MANGATKNRKPAVPPWLVDFAPYTFVHEAVERVCYRFGDGPPVIVLHELFGLTDTDACFAHRLSDRAGVTVHVPVLFGRRTGTRSALDGATAAVDMCLSRQFTLLALGKSSPAVAAVLALAERILAESPGHERYGVVGLCLTGNFALAMMCDRRMTAPVMSEPSTPFGLGPDRGDPGVDPHAMACAKERCSEAAAILGFRFERDMISPVQRFDRLQEALGDGFERHDLCDKRWYAHSVFTTHYSDALGTPTRTALDRVVEFLHERL